MEEVRKKICELCGVEATNICYDCLLYLCNSCFKFLHEKTNNSKHKKEDIDLFFSIDIKCSEHPKVPMSLFCIEEKVFLCPLCFFNYEHDEEHIIIDINNKESLEDYDISFKNCVSDFDKSFNKAKNIKQKIEEEIEGINNLHKNIDEQITESFDRRRFLLKEEENKLKYNLDIKVTEVKEELEKYLRDYNDILISFERVYKAINLYEKENDNYNNEIKTLSYISGIHDKEEKAKDLFIKPMKNLDISFDNYIYKINYKYYYFNGIPIPMNIKVEEKNNRIYISWEIYDSRIKDLDINKIKYLIRIEDDKTFDEFKSSKNNYFLAKNKYEKNIEYEIKIISFIDDDIGNWSEKVKFKINELPKHEINIDKNKD